MKTFRWIKGLCAVLCAMAGAGLAHAQPVLVFAAASLQGPLDTAAQGFAPGARISYGGSGAMARQISLGAPADVVILANGAWMTWLQARADLVAPPVDILGNRLVLVGPADAAPMPAPDAGALLARLNGGRLAMGQHRSVPAGIYGAEWLAAIGAWDALRSHLAETENVRAALALVTRGEVPLALVYASDAVAAGDAVRVLHEVPPDTHSPIRYPAAALTDRGRAFLDHLRATPAPFAAAGFEVLP